MRIKIEVDREWGLEGTSIASKKGNTQGNMETGEDKDKPRMRTSRGQGQGQGQGGVGETR